MCQISIAPVAASAQSVAEVAAMMNSPQSSIVLRFSASLTTPVTEPRNSIGKVRATVTTATQKADPVRLNA